MSGVTLGVMVPAILSSFLASVVEVVEAFTIVLAVGVMRGWKPALMGAGAALAVLALIVIILGPLLDQVPLQLLQLVIGVLLLLFGLGWLRKAILRSAGVIPMHDEIATFDKERKTLEDSAHSEHRTLDWIAGITAFKAVLLEGLEVIFIVIAVGAGRGLTGAAAIGALFACIIVLVVGLLVHKPLSRVPENTLKFAVAIMLSSFGVFWTGEGLGVAWPGQDLLLLPFAGLFLVTGISMAAVLRRNALERAS